MEYAISWTVQCGKSFMLPKYKIYKQRKVYVFRFYVFSDSQSPSPTHKWTDEESY